MGICDFGFVTVFFCFFFLSLNMGELRNVLSVNLSPRLILLLKKINTINYRLLYADFK